MRLYLDSANLAEIKEAMSWGFLAGVTTNPTLLAQEEVPPRELIKKIIDLSRPGLVFLQVLSGEAKNIIQEARELAELDEARIVVKVPLCQKSLPAIHQLAQMNLPICATAIFSPTQAVAAALAGASFVAPYVERISQSGLSGVEVIKQIQLSIRAAGSNCQVLAASVKSLLTWIQLAQAEVGHITMPFSTLRQSFRVDKFLAETVSF